MSASPAAVGPAMRGTGAATRLIIASSVGNALEFYEILVYGYFAVTISKVFFPAANEAVSLLVTLGTFGISFLARPVGAIFLGAYGDRKGRKNALTLSSVGPLARSSSLPRGSKRLRWRRERTPWRW